MTDIELSALTALVAAETAAVNAHVAEHGNGGNFSGVDSPAFEALAAELQRRGILPK